MVQAWMQEEGVTGVGRHAGETTAVKHPASGLHDSSLGVVAESFHSEKHSLRMMR